jgi:hypothetical protein
MASGVAQYWERHLETRCHLALIVRGLTTQTVKGDPERGEGSRSIAKALDLWGGAVRSGDIVPARRIGLPWPPRPRVDKEHGAAAKIGEANIGAVSGGQGHVWKRGTGSKMGIRHAGESRYLV